VVLVLVVDSSSNDNGKTEDIISFDACQMYAFWKVACNNKCQLTLECYFLPMKRWLDFPIRSKK
jgi:hypothetical protein